MKTFYLILFLVAVFAACQERNELRLYKEYYNATETLLDSLEDNFNWTDRYDSDALDKYFEARKEIKK